MSRLALTISCVLGSIVAAVALSAAPPATPSKPPVGEINFARDIQPIFAARCYECHDQRKQTASLRLDLKRGALAGGDSGEPAVVPGKTDDSALIQRVTSTDSLEWMPPEGDRLTPGEIELLRRWIDAGATWPDRGDEPDPRAHWAFQRPQRPALPAVKNEARVRNPIDRFVLARLEEEGLEPSPEADATTLLRRLSLDLVGLPPTINEIDAFLSDVAATSTGGTPVPAGSQLSTLNSQLSPGAHERQVERLLASPHYGERWGRHWLDAARYADSDGYEKDKPRQVWFYRDWVIDALNRDLPYDQFIIEQLAGDLLPGATQNQVVATGFLRNSMINEEGGVDPEQFRMEAMFDRMDAVGKAVLGLTIQCAQCHNHKYDPLTQEEYYRLFAFLNNEHEANVVVYTPEQQKQRAGIFREIARLEGELNHTNPDWPQRMAEWEARVVGDQPEWIVIEPRVEENSAGGQKHQLIPDGSYLVQSYAPTKHRLEMRVTTEVENIAAFRLELLNDPNLPCGGPGRSIKGTCALTEFEVEAAPAGEPEKKEKVKLIGGSADIELRETPLEAIFDDKSGRRRVTGPVALAIDGNDDTAWGIDAGPGRRNQPRKAVFNAEKPISHPGGALLVIYLSQKHGGWNSDDNQTHNLGRFRLSITTSPDASADPLPKRVRDILSIARDERTPAEVDAVFSYWRSTVPEWQEANDRIEGLWRQHPEGTTQLVLMPRNEPRDTRILERGNFLEPRSPVEPGVPAFLHDLSEGVPADRLTLARWLADPRSPTTARALVNRVWQAYFGVGLVGTSEDLGTRCEPPSHPELLDWLAVEFMERGWSLKELHRLIVTSATYRQSSAVAQDRYARDPYNRLLARGPRFRVEAEVVRDIALAASGLLSREIGGPSVYPPLPEFMLKPPVSYGPKTWHESQGPDRYRRGLYTFRFRSVPYPALEAFDAPNGDFACVRRERSNTPLQALVTLNEPVFVECAQALALRTLEEGGTTDEDRLTYVFRRCLSRYPAGAERAELLRLYEKQKSRIAEGWLSAWELAAADAEPKPPLPEGATPTELAAWTIVSRVLLNLDETITKQ